MQQEEIPIQHLSQSFNAIWETIDHCLQFLRNIVNSRQILHENLANHFVSHIFHAIKLCYVFGKQRTGTDELCTKEEESRLLMLSGGIVSVMYYNLYMYSIQQEEINLQQQAHAATSSKSVNIQADATCVSKSDLKETKLFKQAQNMCIKMSAKLWRLHMSQLPVKHSKCSKTKLTQVSSISTLKAYIAENLFSLGK